MFGLGLNLPPYIIAVGPTLKTVDSFYVVVDKLQYKFQSPLKALDICFKLYMTWNADYPEQSQQVWVFLQYAFYKLRTERDVNKAHVSKILQKMGMHRD